MSGYCGKCGQYYDCHYTVHEQECPGEDSHAVVSGSLEDYQQQTGDYGLIQAPDGFNWDEAQRRR